MLKAKTVPVLNILFCLLVCGFMACSTCKEDKISGKIESNNYKGTFYMSILTANGNTDKQKMELHVSLEKSRLNRDYEREILNDLENSGNWHVTVNGAKSTPDFVFSELSNTMTPNINLVMPLSVDSTLWKKDGEDNISISFTSQNGSFMSVADETSVNCFLKNYYTIK